MQSEQSDLTVIGQNARTERSINASLDPNMVPHLHRCLAENDTGILFAKVLTE